MHGAALNRQILVEWCSEGLCKQPKGPDPEELGEGARDGSKVGVDLDQATQPAGELLASAGSLEALIAHDNCSVVPSMPDHPPHGLVNCSALHRQPRALSEPLKLLRAVCRPEPSMYCEKLLLSTRSAYDKL